MREDNRRVSGHRLSTMEIESAVTTLTVPSKVSRAFVLIFSFVLALSVSKDFQLFFEL